MTALLEVDGLSTSYWTAGAPVEAVRDVSFTLQRGEVLGVVGESGSGKTTLALSLLRLIRPPGRITAGAVVFEGENLFRRPRARMREIRGRRIALVPQAAMNAIDPVYRVRRAIAEVVRAHQKVPRRQAERRASALLEAVQLPADRHGAYPHEFSGGMRQRVVLAMALANEPLLLIADEPVTGLDVIVQAQVLALLRDLRTSRGLSLVFISHDLHAVASLADTLLVMRDGEVVERGPVSRVLTDPSHPYTAELLAATPRLPEPGATPATPRPRLDEPADTPARAGSPGRFRPVPPPGDGAVAVDRERGAPLLELSGVRRTFVRHRRVVTAVDGVSLQVRRGEIVGLVGESGSGKTTIARLVLGLISPDRGAIRLDGVDLAALPEARLRPHRRRMHLIFQDPYEALSPRMTVAELVAEPLAIHGLRTAGWRQRVDAALEEAGLTPAASLVGRYPAELSGGQRQRVALARALVTRPDLIVADEPTSMLDASLRGGLLDTMQALRDRHGIGLLFITHDLALANDFCDRVAVLFRGRIVEHGPARAVIGAPRHPYTQALVRAVRDLEPPPHPPVGDSAPPDGCRYRTRCPLAEAICRDEPALREVARDHHAACHLT